MDFSLPEKMTQVLATIRELLTTDIYPLEIEFAKRRSFRAMLPELSRTREKVKKLGLWGPQLPKEHGGMGLTLWSTRW